MLRKNHRIEPAGRPNGAIVQGASSADALPVLGMGECWAIMEECVDSAIESLRERANWTPADAAMAETGRNRTSFASVGPVAVLPVYGIISQRPMLWGWTSTMGLAAAFDAALASPEVKAIVLDIDSPGGGVYGVPELADRIAAASGQTPIVAVANSLMASAAYWIGSAADQLVVTPSGEVGSIGVVSIHLDISKAAERAGLKYTVIRAGKFKFEGNPFEPITDEALADRQQGVDRYHHMFLAAVARNRQTTPERVRSGFGQGRVVGAREAVQLGMADRVGTLDEVLNAALAIAAGQDASRFRSREIRALEADAGVRCEAPRNHHDRSRGIRLIEAEAGIRHNPGTARAERERLLRLHEADAGVRRRPLN